MFIRRMIVVAALLTTACGAGSGPGPLPQGPTPPPAPPGVVTANVYILPGGEALGAFAFGDEAVVIFKGERLRWVNLDTTTHDVVADDPDATDFVGTRSLAPGGEQSLVMTRIGTTRIHCSIHPSMVGTLVVRER
jgi:plastocyanin